MISDIIFDIAGATPADEFAGSQARCRAMEQWGEELRAEVARLAQEGRNPLSIAFRLVADRFYGIGNLDDAVEIVARYYRPNYAREGAE